MQEQVLEIMKPVFNVLLDTAILLIIYFIREVGVWVRAKTKNEVASKYTTMIEDTIVACVQKTNQCYVEALKKEGKFTEEAQQLAFNETKAEIMKILSADAIKYLTEITGDVDAYLTSKIESTVKALK